MKTLKVVYQTIIKILSHIGKRTLEYAEALGRARTAAELSRAGYHKEARNIMLRD